MSDASSGLNASEQEEADAVIEEEKRMGTFRENERRRNVEMRVAAAAAETRRRAAVQHTMPRHVPTYYDPATGREYYSAFSVWNNASPALRAEWKQEGRRTPPDPGLKGLLPLPRPFSGGRASEETEDVGEQAPKKGGGSKKKK